MDDLHFPPCVIVSTGRCGSTLLTHIVAAHPELLPISEIFTALHPGAFPDGVIDGCTFWDTLDRPRGRWTCLVRNAIEPPEVIYPFDASARYKRATGVPPLCLMTLPALTRDVDALYDFLRGEVKVFPPATVGEHYQRLFARLCARFGKHGWVERSGASLNSLTEMVEAFPSARYVHLYRSGIETARSMSRHTAFKLTVASRRLEEWLGVDPFESTDRRRLDRVPTEWHQLLPETFDPQAFMALRVPLEYFAGFWALMEARGLEMLSALPRDQVLHMRYADLLDRPRKEIMRFAKFAGIETSGTTGRSWLETAVGLVRPPLPSAPVEGEDTRRVLFACRVGERRLAAAGLAV